MKLIAMLFDFCIRFLKRSNDQKNIQYRYRENTYAMSIKYFYTLHLTLKFLITSKTNK